MAKSTLIRKFKSGTVEVVQWEGRYNDEPTTFYSLNHQKLDQETKEWKDNPFYSKTDLLNALLGINYILTRSCEEINKAKDEEREAKRTEQNDSPF